MHICIIPYIIVSVVWLILLLRVITYYFWVGEKEKETRYDFSLFINATISQK